MNEASRNRGRRHSLLFPLAIAGATWLMLATAAKAEPPLVLEPEAAHAKVNAGELILVDVRRPSEWAETGVPKGARAITMHGPKGVEGLMSEIDAITQGDKDVPIAFICHSGTRSARMQAALSERGYRSVYDVSAGVVGGLLEQGWIDRGLPVVRIDPVTPGPPGVTPPPQ